MTHEYEKSVDVFCKVVHHARVMVKKVLLYGIPPY